MKNLNLTTLPAALLGLGLVVPVPAFAEESVLPAEPQAQSRATESVQPRVDKKAAEKVAEKRKKITAEAVAAVNETKTALKMLDEKKTKEALAALERATGKLELILARTPDLALAENEERTVKDNETLAKLLEDARKHLKMAELLGYGDKKSFKSMYEQIDQIEEKTAGGKGWFDKIKQQLSDLT